jgi:hypothetical protein
VNRKQQGDIGVAKAVAHYTYHGFAVSVPLGDTTRYDLIIDRGKLKRVQVKTTGYKPKKSYVVQLSTKGGNRSGCGATTPISVTDCELVFIYAMSGETWEFPVREVAGIATLNLSALVDKFRVNTICPCSSADSSVSFRNPVA